MSLYLTNSGASVVLSSGAVPVATGAKAVVQWSDFTPLGAFQPSTCYAYNYQGNGLTHRWRDGTLYLYSYRKPGDSTNALLEFPAPAGGASDSVLRTSAPWTYQSTFRNYGRAWETNTFHEPANALPSGMFWDATSERMYWTFQHGYCNHYEITACLGYSTLNDSTPSGTNQKILKLTSGSPFTYNRFVQSVQRIPQAWADTYVGGRPLMVGCGWSGGPDESISGNGGTGGPTLGAIFAPTTELDGTTVTGGLVPINHWELANGPRVEAVTVIEETPFAVASTSDWTDTDMTSHGCWIDTTDKHGVLVITHECKGNTSAVIQASPSPTTTQVGVPDGSVWTPHIGVEVAVTNASYFHYQNWRTLQAVDGNVLTFGSALSSAPSAGDYVVAGMGYPGGTFQATYRKNRAMVYDPDDLAVSAAGAPYRATPTEHTDVTWAGLSEPFTGNSTRIPRGITFDPVTRRLFVLLQGTHTVVSAGDGALVYVFELQ